MEAKKDVKEALEIDTRLGRRSIEADKIINFPRGLAGLENERSFTLLQIQQGGALLILQSTTTPTLGLMVTDPYSFLESYPVIIGDAEQMLLKLEKPEDAAILVTVSIPMGKPEEACLNLSGPIVINFKTRVGLQVPQSNDGPQKVSFREVFQRISEKGEKASS